MNINTYSLFLLGLSKSQVTNSQDIDKHFDAIIECVQERRKTLKKHLQEKYEVHNQISNVII